MKRGVTIGSNCVPMPSTGVQLTDDFGGRSLFPSDNWWNQDISNAPVDPQSDAYIDYTRIA